MVEYMVKNNKRNSCLPVSGITSAESASQSPQRCLHQDGAEPYRSTFPLLADR